MEVIGSILKAIFKILLKAFLIALWGMCKISLVILEQVEKLLKDGIDKM
jgi:hypothetical protein